MATPWMKNVVKEALLTLREFRDDRVSRIRSVRQPRSLFESRKHQQDRVSYYNAQLQQVKDVLAGDWT